MQSSRHKEKRDLSQLFANLRNMDPSSDNNTTGQDTNRACCTYRYNNIDA